MAPASTSPPPLPLAGRGLWLWMPGDYGVTVDELRDLGVRWTAPEAAITFSNPARGHLRTWAPSIARATMRQWADGGVSCCPFIFPRSRSRAEADREVDSILALIGEGAAAVCLDMEESYETPGGSDRAGYLADAIEQRVPPTFPIVDAPWAWIGSHGAFVPAMRRLVPRLSAHMPQAYTTAFGFSHADYPLDRMDREWAAELAARPAELRRPVLPIFGLFDRATMGALGQPQPKYGDLEIGDVDRFEARYGIAGAPRSYWSYKTARADALARLRDTVVTHETPPTWPSAPPPPIRAGEALHEPTIFDPDRDALPSNLPVPSAADDPVPTCPGTPSAKRASESPSPR